MASVVLTGWKPGLNKVSLTKLIQSRAGASLGVAKGYTDRLLDGETVGLELRAVAEARAFAQEAEALGATAEVKLGQQTARSA
jgi:hypothetical protein